MNELTIDDWVDEILNEESSVFSTITIDGITDFDDINYMDIEESYSGDMS